MADKKKRGHNQDEPSQEYKNFQRLLEDTLAVPKKELDKRRTEYKRAKARRKSEES